ncbi:MAG: DUF2155 domain-containing protein [Pararhodobacter sp.]
MAAWVLASGLAPGLAVLAPALLLPVTPAHAQQRGPEVATGNTAVLRGLDKISGETVDLTLAIGERVLFGRLEITLVACRYPAEAPESDAFAFLEIDSSHNGEQLFRGWMFASSPALNALDHSRYDVWVLSCQ